MAFNPKKIWYEVKQCQDASPKKFDDNTVKDNVTVGKDHSKSPIKGKHFIQ